MNNKENSRKRIVAYTDGSCLNNGKSNAKGGIGVFFGPNDKRNYAGPLIGNIQTNNRAELMAAIKALQIVNFKDDVEIITDSKYLKLAITQWIKSWCKNNWKTSQGKPVKNKDLFKVLLEIEEIKRAKGSKIYWSWVKGHSQSKGNQGADDLARKGSLM